MKTFKQHLLEVFNKKVVCIYAGRFQPFHPGHKESYDNLVSIFGKNNVYIGTSDKVEIPKSPFNFNEKYKIITTMFPDIPKNHIVKIKMPYNPIEILNKLPEDTIYVAAVGEKDNDRIKKYFEPFDTDTLNNKKHLKNYKEGGKYSYIIPKNKDVNLSGTKVREIFKSMNDKEKAFIEIYGKLNNNILKLFKDKIK